jgi:SAM-dependent methyltransferase
MSNYLKIAQHYNDCFKKHGDNHLGVDWPKLEDTLIRHEIMWEMLKNKHKYSLLDFGCGLGHFYQFLKGKEEHWNFSYFGLDINPEMIKECKEKFPECKFDSFDINNEDSGEFQFYQLQKFDYIICNGVFTIKKDLAQEEMMFYMLDVLDKLWKKCKRGLTFNTMSTNVDWKRDDLFHVDLGEMSWIIKDRYTSNFEVKHGYGGLYEQTFYLYK